MTFIPDSQLVDSVLVAEAYSRNGAPILGVVIHHAEGGGTDTWLTRIDGNSSHYVIKYSGKLVQLVPESKAAGSMNPRATRTTDDKPFTQAGVSIQYGRTALNAVLGGYAPTYVNRAVIAIEIEGFAADGPNTAQTVTLVSLIKDIRQRRGPVGLLGHRDQQDYKACPGKLIPWNLLGGHGPATATEDDMLIPYHQVGTEEVAGTVTVLTATSVIPLEGGRKAVAAGITRPAIGVFAIEGLSDAPAYIMEVGGRLSFILADRVEFVPYVTPVPTDCTDEIAAAVAATKASARVVFG